MKYEILIRLTNQGNLVFIQSFPYFNSGSKTDEVSFTKESIKIVAERVRKYTESDVFMNVQNSLYNQIYKCLLIHYCSSGSKSGIKVISVSEISEGGNKELFQREFDELNQPLPSFDAQLAFSEDSLKQLLNENDSSYTLRIIIAHWLSQGIVTDRLLKLECVWRTFERICDYMRHKPIGSRSNIAMGLDLMVAELISHSYRYPQTCAAVNCETYNSLRKLRWREMVENNYKKLSRSSSLEDTYNKFRIRLLDPYKDHRVAQLGLDLIKYRKKELKAYFDYSVIENDLNRKVSQNIDNDIDVVAILCHYAYYLRNRLFHGQSLIRGSIFDTKKLDDMRLEIISHILGTLTVELINQYQHL